MLKNRTQLWGVALLTVYLILFLHDSNLYPHLSVPHRLVLSGLRLILLAAPVLLAFTVGRIRPSIMRSVALTGFILLVPYTLYSVTEIRHITELCPVSEGSYFTDSCSLASWHLLPPFVYALAGIGAYALCLHYLRMRRATWQLALLVLYIALATQFALQSRLNIWSIITQPTDVVVEILNTVKYGRYWLNSVAFTTFIMGISIASIYIPIKLKQRT